MNTRTIIVAFALVVLLLLPQHAAAQSNAAGKMTPGLWEFAIQTVEPTASPAMTSVVCVSKEMAKEMVDPSPSRKKSTDECELTVVPSAANQSAFTVTCAKGKRSSSATFTYFGDRYEGSVTVNWEKVVIRQVHTARRIGPCDEEARGPAGSEN